MDLFRMREKYGRMDMINETVVYFFLNFSLFYPQECEQGYRQGSLHITTEKIFLTWIKLGSFCNEPKEITIFSG